MLTYKLKKEPGLPLYEGLYRFLKADILSGHLAAGEKLPSKRALAAHLEVSLITVETAYNQLLSEGYICARERRGYFVEEGLCAPEAKALPPIPTAQEQTPVLDLTANGPAGFPFSVWSRLQRQVMLDLGQQLLQPLHHQGCLQLRHAIAEHLAQFRGMTVDPENIVIGAGTDFLYNLLIQLLGRDALYAVEDPGYGKIREIYRAGGVESLPVAMDEQGVVPQALGNARVLHISPSHHFPTGIVTPVSRRLELLRWAQQVSGYIIEDDYDSEFRFHSRPVPAMQSLDRQGRVIYMNTFSKSLAPSIRISYMVLPTQLMARFHRELGFYSCTVSSFEQYTLARFLQEGWFEKHINRMRKFYKTRRNRVVAAFDGCPLAKSCTVTEQNAGLHFLVKVDTTLSDTELVNRFAKAGIRVKTLGQYYAGQAPAESAHTLVVNYSGLDESQLFRLNEL